ncbi:MAG: glycosyl hydrolase-related protein, partial [Anaerolineae bacterium]|nr:glycosyl hydrolase-related protein [Anaerolineae bacterium]
GDDSAIVRLYEAHGRPAETTLTPAWTVGRAAETDLLEQPVADLPLADAAVRLELAPHEIKTIRLFA